MSEKIRTRKARDSGVGQKKNGCREKRKNVKARRSCVRPEEKNGCCVKMAGNAKSVAERAKHEE